VCALTIDDAPSESTNNVLDILAEYNVKATFFIIAGNIPGREDVMDRIVKEGHTLGNHLTDTRASIRDDLEIFERKLRECDHALRHYTQSNAFDEGKETKNHSDISMKWLRPASGWFTTRMREIVNKHGYYICLGSVYPHDAQIKVESLNAWYLRQRTRSGSIIILHDRSWTVGVLKSALPELVEKFKFVSLEELRFHHKRT
jgi:peptidoglycan/xylan/chitin deacetylase (PgdA/CDA1 family)